jgi:hypothetical protein
MATMKVWQSNLTIKEIKKNKHGEDVIFSDGVNQIKCRYEYDHGVIKFWLTDPELPSYMRENLFGTWNTDISDAMQNFYVNFMIQDNFYTELQNKKENKNES